MGFCRENLIAIFLVFLLLLLIIIARASLKLSKTFFLICGADIAAIVALLAIIVIRRRFNNRRQALERQIHSQGRDLRIDYSFLRKVAGLPTKFRLRELEEATDGFRSLLGRGGSASVFKGILTDGTAVAVKRIDREERGDKEFKSEVAAIASVQHVNLVRLLGYCSSSSAAAAPRFLVYDYIHNGSLDNWIFVKMRGKNVRSGCLPWDLRCRVALDVARALSYLHHDCRSCILHLDVKPENILLDENFRASVSDFGLSKLKGREESRVVTTICGTRGYLAPEWLLENGVSEKCDVYSYGMVVLEIIGGRRNICCNDNANDLSKKKFVVFPKIVVEKYREGKLMEIVDDRLLRNGARVDERELKGMVRVALWCIQEKPKLRPTMAEVVEMMEGRVVVEDPPATEVVVVDAVCDRFCRVVVHEHDTPTSSTCSFAFSTLSPR